MNIETNHLASEKELSTYGQEERRRYRPVPAHLEPAATGILAGRDHAVVPRSSRSPLARWAADERRKERAEKRRKIARASRRGNRGRS